MVVEILTLTWFDPWHERFHLSSSFVSTVELFSITLLCIFPNSELILRFPFWEDQMLQIICFFQILELFQNMKLIETDNCEFTGRWPISNSAGQVWGGIWGRLLTILISTVTASINVTMSMVLFNWNNKHMFSRYFYSRPKKQKIFSNKRMKILEMFNSFINVKYILF